MPDVTTAEILGLNFERAVSPMTSRDKDVFEFQCPKCGYAIEQSVKALRAQERMRCEGCGVGINIDMNPLVSG